MSDSTDVVWSGFRGTAPSSNSDYRGLTGGSASEAFPVGAIYLSVTGVNPATELGYGTWSAFGQGQMLVGYKSGDADFGTVLATGGAKTMTPAGTVAAPTISGSTASEGSHTHSVTSNVAVGNHTFTQPTISWPAGVPTAANESAHTHAITQSAFGTISRGNSGTLVGVYSSGGVVTTPSGAGSAHTHTISWPAGVPTNASGAVDAHSVTNNAVTSGAGSSHLHGAGTLAASAPAFTGSAGSILNPYIVVYLWRRTA